MALSEPLHILQYLPSEGYFRFLLPCLMAFLPIYPDDGLCFVAKETGTALTVHPHSSVWLVLSRRLPGSGHSWFLLADLGWTESLTQFSLLICKTWLKLARLQWNELFGNIGDKFLLLYKLLSINAIENAVRLWNPRDWEGNFHWNNRGVCRDCCRKQIN